MPQTFGPWPPSIVPPSVRWAAVAVPQRKPSGKALTNPPPADGGVVTSPSRATAGTNSMESWEAGCVRTSTPPATAAHASATPDDDAGPLFGRSPAQIGDNAYAAATESDGESLCCTIHARLCRMRSAQTTTTAGGMGPRRPVSRQRRRHPAAERVVMRVTGLGSMVEAERAAGSTTEAGAARQGGAGSVLPALPAVTAAGGHRGAGW